MKKNILGFMAIAAVAALSLASCNKSQPQVEAKSESKAPAELKIAYVEVDSIMTQYTFAKEYSALLEKKGQNIQATLAQKQQNLQAAAANFQQKIQQNALTREQAEAIQAGLQKRLSNEFAAEQAKYNKALHDSIAHYLAAYNKDKKYSIILSKSGDNLLYADKAYDITNEVINGLNKAYKGKLKSETAAPAKK
jgi:outer membrane protein